MTIKPAWRRLRAILRPGVVERELEEEIAFHLSREAERHRALGLGAADAARRARVAFGGVERYKEDYRDARGDRGWRDTAGDLRYALRLLRRNPGLTAAVLATLTLGIGANVALFSVVNAVLVRPLPFPAPTRLVMLWEDNADKGWKQQVVAPANMLDWQEQVRSFDGLAGYASFMQDVTVTGKGEPAVLRSLAVTGTFFEVLGVRPAHGAGFDERDTWEGGGARAVVSDRVFQERLGGDPSRVGSSLVLNGVPVQVVGVMDRGFGFPSRDVDLWTPTRWDPAERGQAYFRRAHWLRAFARLGPGVTLQQANAELQAVMGRLEAQFPETNTHMKAGLGDLHAFQVGEARRPLLVLFGATGLLLLIACANVGSLLLVRAVGREREVVVRRALGAGRQRLVRQAFTESLVLSGAGAACGLAAGWAGTRVFATMIPRGFLPTTDLQPDLAVFAFVALVAVAAAALFAVAPAWWSARRDPADVLRDAPRTSTEGRRGRAWASALAVGEVALALMLTVGAGLMVRSFRALTTVDPGFRSEGVLTTRLSLPRSRYDADAKVVGFLERLVERSGAMPSVTSAAATTWVPLDGYGAWTSDFSVRGREGTDAIHEVAHRSVTPGYFRTMGVRLLAGRDFTPADRDGAERVVIINQAVADAAFRGRDPLGQLITFDAEPDSASVWRRVVGVAGNERQHSLARESQIEIFTPMAQDPSTSFRIVVSTTGETRSVATAFKGALAELDGTLAPASIRTMEEARVVSLSRDRLLASLFLAFAVVGAGLALIGVYGVVAQFAQRREQEMGIRLALGATSGSIRWLVVRQGVLLGALGVSIGLLGALAIGGSIRRLLYGVSPTDPVTLAAMPVLLLCTCLVAALIPAFRVTRTDPSSVFRAST